MSEKENNTIHYKAGINYNIPSWFNCIYTSCNKKKKAIPFIVVLSLNLLLQLPETAYSQDIHFTQFFTNPLILSPASTGNFQGNIRGGVNYKYQWPWATDQQVFNYHSQNAYADISFLQDRVKRGWMGLGLNFLNDEAGDGRLRYMRFGGSVAWHQSFERENRYILSLGFQANYFSKTADFEKYYYNNQWVEDEGFDRSLNNFENPNQTRINGFDMGFGVNFDAKPTDKVRLSSTFAMLHLNKPNDQFYNRSNNQLGYRFTGSLSGDFDISRSTILKTDVYYTYQKKAWETVFGAMVGIKAGEAYRKENNSIFWIGSYFRMIDAWSPIVGYSYKQCRLLINYDVIISKLSRTGKLNGGLEISLVLVAGWKHKQNEQKWACPKF
ncbi:MAG: PorP/SprF family type IX secretion system membrane protein [Chitinophagales bacterium]|nr:PorP/SprF family type IX secretion system membrane protein [Chitinophagales bacterium]